MALASRLFAPHYAKAAPRRCGAKAAALRADPGNSAEIIGEIEPGEAFNLLDITAGWAWGFRPSDHLVGYLAASDLAEPD